MGWNYLMSISPLGQAVVRSRAYARLNISMSRPRPKLINVMVVDRAGQNRKFINEVGGAVLGSVLSACPA